MRKDDESFSLGGWIDEPTEVFDLSEELNAQLQDMMTGLAEFCLANRIPMVVAAGVEEDESQVRIAQRSVFPYGRANAVLLSMNAVATGGINEQTLELLAFTLHADGEHTAKSRKPKLSIVH